MRNTTQHAHDKTRDVKRRETKTLVLRPGYLIATEYSARGGVSFEHREKTKNKGTVVVERVRKTDSEKVLQHSRAVINAAYHATAMSSVYTPIGLWYVDEEMLPSFKAAMSDSIEGAAIVNEIAEAEESERRVSIRYYLVQLDPSNEDLAFRLGQHVRELLTTIRDCLVNLDRKNFELQWDKARNLERLATGRQSELIEAALGQLKDEKKIMLSRLRDLNTRAYHFDQVEKAIEKLPGLD